MTLTLGPRDQAFFSVLKGSLEGVTLNQQEKNLYLGLGFPSQEGYDAAGWSKVETELKSWCDGNNARHRQNGWALLTHGDLDHAVGAYVASHGGQVVFVRHKEGWMPLISKQWPQHASAGCFLPTPSLAQGRIEDEICTKSWGGESLESYLGGLFVAGGSTSALQSAKVTVPCPEGSPSPLLNPPHLCDPRVLQAIKFSTRQHDIYVAAKDKTGKASPLDEKYGSSSPTDPTGGLAKSNPIGNRPSPLGQLPGLAPSSQRGGLLGQLPGLGKPAGLDSIKAPDDPFAKAREGNLSEGSGAPKEAEKPEAAEEVPDSPVSIASEEALEYEEDDFEGDDSINSEDITIDAADESVEEVSMGFSSMSPLSAGWNVEDASASSNMIDKLGHVEQADRVAK